LALTRFSLPIRSLLSLSSVFVLVFLFAAPDPFCYSVCSRVTRQALIFLLRCIGQLESSWSASWFPLPDQFSLPRAWLPRAGSGGLGSALRLYRYQRFLRSSFLLALIFLFSSGVFPGRASVLQQSAPPEFDLCCSPIFRVFSTGVLAQARQCFPLAHKHALAPSLPPAANNSSWHRFLSTRLVLQSTLAPDPVFILPSRATPPWARNQLFLGLLPQLSGLDPVPSNFSSFPRGCAAPGRVAATFLADDCCSARAGLSCSGGVPVAI
jgi:hypothetical protein